MGRSMSWVAVDGLPAQELLQRLDFVDTGEPTQPGVCHAAGALLPSGAYVIVFDTFFHPVMQGTTLEENLSSGATVIACTEDEKTNTSLACLYRNNKRVWEASHLLNLGEVHFATKGKVPKVAAALLEAAQRVHAESGHDAVMGVPAGVAFTACGFTMDETQGLRFNRLALAPLDRFARSKVTWRLLQQMEAAAAFEAARPDIADAVTQRLERALTPLGFRTESRPGGPSRFARTNDWGTQAVWTLPHQSGRHNVHFGIWHPQVEKLLDECGVTFMKTEESTLRFALSTLERIPSFNIHSAVELDVYLDLMEQRVGHWARQMEDVKGLDQLADRAFRCDDLSALSQRDCAAVIALAHMAGNPDVDMIVQSSAQSEGGVARLRTLAAYVREKMPA